MTDDSPPAFEIRNVTLVHAAVLAELHRACFDGQPWHRPWSEAEMAQVLALPSTRGWLALARREGIVATEPEPAGMLLVQVAGPEADILTLCVRPGQWRRRGTAHALITQGEADLRVVGVEQVFLEVATANTSASAFYEKIGYKILGSRPGYYSNKSGQVFDATTRGNTL